MKYVEYARQRYAAALAEIDRLKQSEFPYLHIREALLEIEQVLNSQLDYLNKLDSGSNPLVAKNACSQSLGVLAIHAPYLGFVLRSTNVRNAFELYAPILRIGRLLLGADTKVLLSSEWEYSPFVFLPTSELAKFVLIGFPAFESSNPLLFPLAGHELGHNVWLQRNLASKYDAPLTQAVLEAIRTSFWSEFKTYQPNALPTNLITDMFVRQSWLPALAFASRQLEEIFCDIMGLRLFAEAYLDAFAYMIAPTIPGSRSFSYPNLKKRVEYMIRGATALGVTPPTGYADLFDDQSEPNGLAEKLLVSIADSSVDGLVDDVIQDAKKIADDAGVPVREQSKIELINADFSMVVPANGNHTLSDLLNAGWQCNHKLDLWSHVPNIEDKDRRRIMFDLVLKSLEVSEYYVRIGEP